MILKGWSPSLPAQFPAQCPVSRRGESARLSIRPLGGEGARPRYDQGSDGPGETFPRQLCSSRPPAKPAGYIKPRHLHHSPRVKD